MALLDYVPESRPVVVNGKPLFVVEGLSLDTLAVLVKTYLPDFDAIFDIVTNGQNSDESWMDHLQRISQAVVMQAPGLAANIIAVSSKEELSEELVRIARRLPFPIQVNALMEIGQLTFDEVGGVKKAMESMTALLMRLRTKMIKQPPVSETHSSSGFTTALGAM